MSKDLETLPWLLGHGAVLEDALARCRAEGMNARAFDVLHPQSAAFFSRLSACNQVAFGGLGMPAWVQLDCCALPGLMVGWGGPGLGLKGAVRARVQALAPGRGSEDFWPYSEYCAIARGKDAVVGVSSFSLLPGRGLATRAKALGLWLSGAARQIGVTQWSNSAAGLHCRFGPLDVLRAQTANHSVPDQTFVYCVQLPEPAQLLAMARGQTLTQAPCTGPLQSEPVDEDLGARVQAMLDRGSKVRIVGWSQDHVALQVVNNDDGPVL